MPFDSVGVGHAALGRRGRERPRGRDGVGEEKLVQIQDSFIAWPNELHAKRQFPNDHLGG